MDRTADRVPVTEGLIAYDNNLDLVRVTLEGVREDHGVKWYECFDTLTGKRSPMMDGGRLATVHLDYDGKRHVAREELVERYIALFDADDEPQWTFDAEPCGACGAPREEDEDGQASMQHDDGCLYLAAQDEQDWRFVEAIRS